MCKDREEAKKYAELKESRQIWRFFGIMFFCLFICLIVVVIAVSDREISLIEVLEISQFNLPENVFAVGVRFRELETEKESQKAFLVGLEENRIIKKGGKYALIYEGCSDEKLMKVGIKHKLLKVYELR